MLELWVTDIRRLVREGLDLSTSISDQGLRGRIEQIVLDHEQAGMWTAAQKGRLVKRVYDTFRGLDVLQPYIDDPRISEIMINSHTEIFIEESGRVTQAPIVFETSERLEDIIQSIVAQVNRVVNESSPIVDARLANGSRVHVVLPPISLKGPTMTIRKFPDHPLTMAELVLRGALTEEAAAFLQQLVAAKYNIFISGGTGSGKTTFLNALSQFIPSDERVITIEDSAELQIRTVPNLVSLETRNANTEGKGEITIRELIRSSLRMRPDRIVVGEVRGAECLDMLQAMNTGHAGSLSTGHANGTQDMMSRLETMVLSGALLPIEVIRQQISTALDIVIHLGRLRDHSRRVMEISEVIGYQAGEVVLQPLFVFQENSKSGEELKGQLVATGRTLVHQQKLERAGLVRILSVREGVVEPC